jgi:hypothetical protein
LSSSGSFSNGDGEPACGIVTAYTEFLTVSPGSVEPFEVNEEKAPGSVEPFEVNEEKAPGCVGVFEVNEKKLPARSSHSK